MKRIYGILGVALVVLAMAVSTTPASAATSSGLSITPRKDYILEPGKTVTDKLTIGNLDKKNDLIISLKAIDFTYTDESGTPKLMLAANAPLTSWSLKPFMKLPDAVTIPAGKSKTVEYTISIPANQGAGSYYSAIEYEASGAAGGNVNLNASGVTLAFVSIPGVVKENMSLKKFGAFQPDSTGTTGKFIYIATDKVPEELAFTLSNDGNVAENPAGSIILKDTFGNTVKTIANANPRASLALIGQTRRFEVCINPNERKVDFNGTATTKEVTCAPVKLKPGRYTANLDVFYGQNGNNTHEVTGIATFWYLPWWFLAVVLLILLIIAGGITWVVRKIRGAGKPKERKFKIGRR